MRRWHWRAPSAAAPVAEAAKPAAMPPPPTQPRRPDGSPGSAPPALPSDGFEHYRGMTRRRRLLVLALACATAVAIVLTLLDPPGGVQRHRPPLAADVANCGAGQTSGCVGSKTDVLPLASPPSPSTATAPSAGASATPR